MRGNLIRLDLFCDSVRDGTHDTPKPKLEGRYLVTSRAIKNNTIDFDNCYFISQKDFDKINKRSLVEKWDVLMTMIGTVGRLLLVKEKPDFAIKNIALFKVGDEIKAKWLYYYLSTPDVQRYFEMIANGTSQHFIGLGYMRKFKIPNITQSTGKIISILSAYDSLIENNTKQIRLLEQMAENLYKEWFVRFRFPGHENTEFVDGLPKGWRFDNLFHVANVSYGYAFKSELFCDDKTLNAVVRIRDIQDNRTDTYTKEQCDDKYLIEENAIIIGMDGIFHMCLWNGKRAYLNQRVVKITSKNANLCNYLLLMDIRPQIKFWEQVISGTTVAHLGDKHLRKIKVLIPEETILVKANEHIELLMKEKNKLFKEISILSRQRDLLLPRLMSGKLEVKA